MEFRRLGNCGMKVSALALGTHDLADGTTDKTLIRKAFDRGINFIDTSCSYGEFGAVEKTLGPLLKDLPRDEIVVGTKVRFGYGAQGANSRGLSRKHIRHSIEISLQRLQLDFIDLYQLHQWDPECPVAETVGMLDELRRQGKFLYWGLSNMNSARTLHFLKACDELGVPYPVSHQPEFSLLEATLVETRGQYMGLDQIAPAHGLGIIPFGPLCGGLLTGKYRKGVPEQSRADRRGEKWREKHLTPARMKAVEQLAGIASEAGIPLAQLALAWVISRPFVSAAIIGATNERQLEENLKAVEIKLSADTLAAIEKVREEYKAAVPFAA